VLAQGFVRVATRTVTTTGERVLVVGIVACLPRSRRQSPWCSAIKWAKSMVFVDQFRKSWLKGSGPLIPAAH